MFITRITVWLNNTNSLDINTNALEESLPLIDIDKKKKKEENRKETDIQNEIQSSETHFKNVNEELELNVTR